MGGRLKGGHDGIWRTGEKPVPKPILLACKGWEAEQAA